MQEAVRPGPGSVILARIQNRLRRFRQEIKDKYNMVSLIVSKPSNQFSVSRLESLYNEYGPHVYSLCLRLLTNQKPAEDATVDTFVRFWQNANLEWDGPDSGSRLRELAIKACRKKDRNSWLWKLRSFFAR